MTTTSMANAWNRLQRIESARSDVLGHDADPKTRAEHRFALGIADDADLEVLAPEFPQQILVLLADAFETDGRSWLEQLLASPAERLAVDAAAAQNRAQLLEGVRALRRLARHGDFQTPQGWRRAARRGVGTVAVDARRRGGSEFLRSALNTALGLLRGAGAGRLCWAMLPRIFRGACDAEQ